MRPDALQSSRRSARSTRGVWKMCYNSRKKTRRTYSTSRTRSTALIRKSSPAKPTRRMRYVPILLLSPLFPSLLFSFWLLSFWSLFNSTVNLPLCLSSWHRRLTFTLNDQSNPIKRGLRQRIRSLGCLTTALLIRAPASSDINRPNLTLLVLFF